MMGVKGQIAWNKTKIDEAELISLYSTSKTAVRDLAARYGVSIQAIYGRLKALGVKRRSNSEAHAGLQVGEKNSIWKGGRRVGSNGYVWVRHDGREVLEHRLVAEKMLGRKLLAVEVVHHKNHVTTDNRPENLEIISSQSAHMRKHLTSDRAREIGRAGGWKARARR